MIKITHTEGTPNPNALKYMTDTRLVGQGALACESAAEAESLPLAKAVFDLGNINSVYIQENFVSVNAKPGADWAKIRATVELGLADFTPVEVADRPDRPPAGEQDELLEKIHETIDKYVRPALASDGGGLEIHGLEGTTVLVRYQGACGGCMSAVTGTLMAIENLLQTEVDENLTVAAI